MRYWIWWNDLIQGPFEPDELTGLKAFSEDLLVCMEDRQDWVPASRVADLAPEVERFRSDRAAPRYPPPPPPKRPASVTPLQGEFFPDPPGQQKLIETGDEPKGPYAFRPLYLESTDAPAYYVGRATMPFHFVHPPQSSAAVLEFRVPETAQILIDPPALVRESPLPVVEELPVVPLEILREPEPIPVPDTKTFDLPPSPYEERVPVKRLSWLPWLLGVALAVTAIGGLGYWLVDRVSTRAAIKETQVVEPRVMPKPKPMMNVPVKVVEYTRTKSQEAMLFAQKTPTPRRARPQAPVVVSASAHTPVRAAIPKPAVTPKPVVAVKPISPAKTPPPVPTKDEILDAIIDSEEKPVPASAILEPVSEQPVPSPWKGKQNEAIGYVQNKNLPKYKITIGTQARTLLQQMHEKELIHAAETGERLYQPDKIAWTALQEEGSAYRVYLNFMAWQLSGERIQSRSYQFLVDVKTKEVRAENAMTQQDLLSQPADLTFKHNPMATDIESILGGVDTYNKHKMRLMIVKQSRRNRDERKSIDSSMDAAKQKVRRAAAYFRKTYENKALDNLAKAYQFSDLLKD